MTVAQQPVRIWWRNWLLFTEEDQQTAHISQKHVWSLWVSVWHVLVIVLCRFKTLNNPMHLVLSCTRHLIFHWLIWTVKAMSVITSCKSLALWFHMSMEWLWKWLWLRETWMSHLQFCLLRYFILVLTLKAECSRQAGFCTHLFSFSLGKQNGVNWDKYKFGTVICNLLFQVSIYERTE